jgi:hypothetical protein
VKVSVEPATPESHGYRVLVALTPARQRNAVSEGIALGLLICGRDALPFDKVRLDLAFSQAWRSWNFRDRYPQVNTDLRRGSDGIWVMTHVDLRKASATLYWQQDDGEFRIYVRDTSWQPENSDDLAFAVGLIGGGVPLSGWEKLAREFLGRFER